MMDVMETVSGIVDNVVFRNEQNDYTVLEINSDGELITAVGTMPLVFEGEEVILKGQWTYHKEFGKQFAFVSFDKRLPGDIEGIINYLSSRTVKGVGPVTALKIVNRFGTDTFDVMENHPKWLADIPGITMKKAAKISESFREQSEMRNAMMFFKDYIGVNEVSRVYKRLGGESVGIVSSNPYILCGGSYGIPFDKVDKLAESLGFTKNDEQRVLCGIKYVLEYNAFGNGHTFLPKEKLASASAQLLSLDESYVYQLLEEFIEREELKQYNTQGKELVMTLEVMEAEQYIADRIKSMSAQLTSFSPTDIATLIYAVESKMNITYDELQRLALFRCLSSGVLIITGGPGTGKTTVVKALIALFDKIGWDTVLAAPTGRAAKRLSEATSEEAKTLHRLLEMEPSITDGELVFGRNATYPIEERVVIVDEASMIDLRLMEALLKALKRGARLVLIGDIDQLPSVGRETCLPTLYIQTELKPLRFPLYSVSQARALSSQTRIG